MLYIVATPIGNLKDITLRALEVLKEVDLILAEDTRKAKILLNHYQIKKPIISYHQHSSSKKIERIIQFLKKGKKIALISEAGTPGICDPAPKLILEAKKVIKNLKIIPVPGPCAFIAALSVSGVYGDRFLFLGFLPKKKKRQKFLKRILEEKYPVIFYESCHRILKTLEEIKNLSQKTGKWRKIIVFKEITKIFEKKFEGSITDVLNQLKKEKIKGEFVVIVI